MLALLSIRNLAIYWVLITASALAEQQNLAVATRPESVTIGFSGDYFVSYMGVEKVDGEADGGVVRVKGDRVMYFCEGMTDPKGIVFFGDHLMTTDITKIWKVNQTGEKELFVGPEDFPNPPKFLNDIAVSPDGESILVTDMGEVKRMFGPDGLWPLDSEEAKSVPQEGRVYRISPLGKVTEVIAPNPHTLFPNGVDVLDDGTLRIASFFKGEVLEQTESGWKTIARGHRTADAIVHDAKGRFYVSEVGTGRVTRYDADGSSPHELGEGLRSAADMFVDESAQKLIIPDTAAGELVFVDL